MSEHDPTVFPSNWISSFMRRTRYKPLMWAISFKNRKMIHAGRDVYSCISLLILLTLSQDKFDDAETFKKCFIAALNFCDESLNDSNAQYYKLNQVEIDQLKKGAEQNAECVRWRARCLNLWLFYRQWWGNKERLSRVEEQLKAFGVIDEKFTWNEVKKVASEAKLRLKELRHLAKDIKAAKIRVTARELIELLTIASPFVLVSGYLYDHFYLSYFGIDTTMFFTLSDYLATSVEQIRTCLFSSLTAVVAALFGFHQSSRETYQVRQRRHKGDTKWYLIMLAVTAIGVPLGAQKGELSFIGTLYLFLVLAIYGTTSFIARKFFDGGVRKVFVLFFLQYYAINLWYGIEMARFKVEGILAKGEFVTAVQLDKPEKGYNFLAANSQYAFFYNPTTQSTLVLPKTEIKSVKIKRLFDNN